MPVSDHELDAVRQELSETIRDLENIRQHSQPHIHLRDDVPTWWDAAMIRLRRARDELYRRSHEQASPAE